jgi:hypothetical protein
MKYVRGFVYLPYDNNPSTPVDPGDDDDMWTDAEKKIVLDGLKAQGEAIARLEDHVYGDSGVEPIVKQIRSALQPSDAQDKPLSAATIDNQLKQIRRAERKVAAAAGVTPATKPVDGNMLEAKV